ncbi:MAG: DUF6529 family protein [Acidimicrobiales bacterium]
MTTVEEALGPQQSRSQSVGPLLMLIAVGAAVSLTLGIYSKVHDPTLQTIYTFGFPSMLPMKAWFATGAATLALLQLTSALWLWEKLPTSRPTPSWLGTAHRWTGTAAFLVTLPVAYHCLWSLGFKDTSPRVLAHSILGLLFYGAFATKMLALRSEKLPAWSLPAIGGSLVAILIGIWMTSALWFFTNVGFPGI